MSIRLNKLLARRGLGARRKCDAMVAEGRVRVNGRVVTEPGTTVEEGRDRVEVDGRPLPGAQQHSYFVINKPVGVITTLDDPQGRRTIAEFLPRGKRLFPVGRLDADTSGLLLLTNDGELAHRLMHPRYGVEKIYRVRLEREPGSRQLERLAAGVEFAPGMSSAPARVRRIDPGFDAIMIEVAIHEGRFRQVRKMCEAVGLTVTGLHRVAYGPVRLGPLSRGMWRELSDAEVERLRAASSRPRRRTPGDARPAAGSRPARPVRPAPPRDARPFEDDEAEIEETWAGGAGPLADMDDGGEEWPARGGRARGDRDFLESGERPARASGELPWHAPGYRRGTAAADARRRREERPARGPGRRSESSRRDPQRDAAGGAEFGAPRGPRGGRELAPAPRGRRAERPGARFGASRGPGREEPVAERARGSRRAGPGEERARGPRGERPGSGRFGAPRGRRREEPGAERARGPRREGPGAERFGAPRGPRGERSRDTRPRSGNASDERRGAPGSRAGRPARSSDARAFSPRSERGSGPDRARRGRGAPDAGARGRRQGQGGRPGRGRKS